MWLHLFFVILGFIVGTFGTLVGAGGGFVLMPVLLLMFPDNNPQVLTSISLAVVFFNAASGSVAYSRLKKIDYRSGLIFAASAVPGAVLGSLTVKYFNRDVFNVIFGILLVVVSIYLFFKPQRTITKSDSIEKNFKRKVIDIDNVEYVYSFNGKIGVLLSIAIGYISSLLGIGGGIIHVPAMVNILNFPVHIATATSHFVLAIIALAGTLVHIFEGAFTEESIYQTLLLSIGVVAGAQLGARLSKKIHGRWILRGLALALFFVGIRIFLMSL